jgi:aarF domain-containing kinase
LLDELTTSAVLVMEWIDGTRLTDIDAMLAMGLQPTALLARGVRCSLHQLLETGFMHSDPHPGNLLVGRDGSLVYLDFGMVVEVGPGGYCLPCHSTQIEPSCIDLSAIV